MKIGNEIKKRRESLGMSRDELSEKTGVARSTLQRIEGGGNTTYETTKKIIDALENAEHDRDQT